MSKIKKRKTADKEAEISLIDFNQTPNTELFIEDVRTLCSASCGVIVVRTREFHRAAMTLYEFAIGKQNTKFRHWMVTDGWRDIPVAPTNQLSAAQLVQGFGNSAANVADLDDATADGEFLLDLYPKNVVGDGKMEPASALEAMFDMIPADEAANLGGVYVMFSPEDAFGGPGFQECLRRISSTALDVDARLFLLCHDSVEIPERMFEEVKVLDFLPPNAAELYAELEHNLQNFELEGASDDFEPDLKEADKQRIVRNALGLSSMDFSTAISIALVRQDESLKEGEDLDVDIIVKTILETKLEMIKKNPILEYKEAVPEAEVGGLDLLKNWLRRRKKAFTPEARAFGVDMPKGILAAGIPGSGKSLVAKAFSSVLGIPCVALDIGKVFGSLVGQSEGQMRAALKLVEAMAPVVLLMDEIDKGFSNTSGGGDSGTSARVFGTFLTWMQERKSDEKPVIVVFTANNVEGLPPELMRKGRLDEIFCVSFPSPEERKQIFHIHLKKRGHDIPDDELNEVIKHTKDFVGAEIEAVVQEAILTAFENDHKTVTSEVLVPAAKEMKPLKEVYPERVNAMNKWARDNAKPASSHYDFQEHLETAHQVGTSTPSRSQTKRIVKPRRAGRS